MTTYPRSKPTLIATSPKKRKEPSNPNARVEDTKTNIAKTTIITIRIFSSLRIVKSPVLAATIVAVMSKTTSEMTSRLVTYSARMEKLMPSVNESKTNRAFNDCWLGLNTKFIQHVFFIWKFKAIESNDSFRFIYLLKQLNWGGRLMEESQLTLTKNRPIRFILGIVLGSVIGGVLLALFSGSLAPFWIQNIVLSGMTWSAFALILFGYFYKKNGEKTFSIDFLFGIGIGMTLAWFVGAGNGTLTLSDITF
jgi:hypothetical protein